MKNEVSAIPLVRREGKLWLIEPPKSETRVSFVWDPKLRAEAPSLRIVDVVPSWHSYGYHGLFKPSVRECLDALPARYKGVPGLHFEVWGPDDADDLNRRGCLRSSGPLNQDGKHLACVVLYVAAEEGVE